MTNLKTGLGLVVAGAALAAGGFMLGRVSVPPARIPDSYVDLAAAPAELRKLMSTPPFVEMLAGIIHVKDGRIELYNAMADSAPLQMPEGYPAWPGPFRLMTPRDGMRWIDTKLAAGEDLSRSKARWTIVNIWATWCAPCLAELPDLDRLAGELDGAGVGVFTIDADTQGKDTPGSVKALFEVKGYSNLAPVTAESTGVDAVLAAASMNRSRASFPTTLIFAPGGEIFGYVADTSDVSAGEAGWASPQMIDFFRKLSAMPAPA